jgi:release factor glutamine methyltransferase
MSGLPNRLQRARETLQDSWVFRFANGLSVKTDPFMRPDTARVLPIGGPQDVILNRLVNSPETVAAKRVFDPFAGSGVLGLMALRLGASHVDFLDVSPRAHAFQLENAKRNGFPADRYRANLGSIADFEPAEPYDLVLANPPLVPTPRGIEGTLTSNGGPEGDTLARVLFARLDRLLHDAGEAFIYLMQLVDRGEPLIARAAVEQLPSRTLEFTPVQQRATPLEEYAGAYLRCFPLHEAQIRAWETELRARHSSELAVQHYVVHVQPVRPGLGVWQTTENLAEKYGENMAYPEAANRELALARVMENVVPHAEKT